MSNNFERDLKALELSLGNLKLHQDNHIWDLLQAVRFAAVHHGDQKRKYTGEPYIVHCFEVAMTVHRAGGTIEMVIAAILHDVVEDTPATLEQVRATFGDIVAGYVDALTEKRPEGYNRAQRKMLYTNQLREAPNEVKTIKLADLLSNTRDIVEHDVNFAVVYLREKAEVLEILKDGDPTLYAAAKMSLLNGYAHVAKVKDEAKVQKEV